MERSGAIQFLAQFDFYNLMGEDVAIGKDPSVKKETTVIQLLWSAVVLENWEPRYV